MDKKFRDLLARYVSGKCSQEEMEKIHRWYEEIANRDLELNEGEKKAIRARMLSNIQKTLPAGGVKRRYLFAYPFVKVAAAVLVLMVFGLWLLTDGGLLPDNRVAESIQPAAEVIVENQGDSVRVYPLSDGSEVRLEPFSELRFSRNFSPGKREVYLTGKAFFDIAKDSLRPFYVYTGTVATRVLGTSFFVDAPANALKVEVKVITGRVSVFQIKTDPAAKMEEPSAINKNAMANGVVLSPNQKVEYFIDDDHWVTGLVETPVPVKPIDDYNLSFVYENTDLTTILDNVHERYGIEVVTENEKILKCTFTGDVSKMTLYDMLDVISNSIGSTYEVKGTRILVSGKGCD